MALRRGDEVIFYNDPWSGPRFEVLAVDGPLACVRCLCDCGLQQATGHYSKRQHLEGWGFADWYRKYEKPADVVQLNPNAE